MPDPCRPADGSGPMRVLAVLSAVFLVFTAAAAGGVLYALHYYGRGLPDYHQLAVHEPPTVTRVHAGDGRLLAEYATEKRVFVPIAAMPKRVINAFLAAEDKNFFSHPGVDFVSVLRATVRNLVNFGKGRRLQGASTITQQGGEELPADQRGIGRAQGEGSDSRLPHRARLFQAAHPRALSQRNLSRHRLVRRRRSRAQLLQQVARRPHGRRGGVSRGPAQGAQQLPPAAPSPGREGAARLGDRADARRGLHRPGRGGAGGGRALAMESRDPTEFYRADYFTEEVRRRLIERYGEETLYEGGLSVRTTVDPRLQDIAVRALRAALIEYDRRHGWRGPIARIDASAGWGPRLAAIAPAPGRGRLAARRGCSRSTPARPISA